ncbi:MAG: hypothetical protein AABM29_02850 [Actinomycetota bacterium]
MTVATEERDSEGVATSQLAKIDRALAETKTRLSRARFAARHEIETAADVARPLDQYGHAVAVKRRAPDPEEARRLTLELLERVETEGLLLEVARSHGRGLLFARDPRVQVELADAERAKTEIVNRRRDFLTEHGDALKAEADASDMREMRDALASDDPARVREALATG